MARKAAKTARSVSPDKLRWLLLMHQLPAKPDYLRVKMGRRLAGIGAVPLKNAVHLMPFGEEHRESLNWIAREIREAGGEAHLVEAHLLEGVTDEGATRLFQEARTRDYDVLLEEARKQIAEGESSQGASSTATRLARRLADIQAIDYFPPPGRAAVEDAVRQLAGGVVHDQEAALDPVDYRNRMWVTRANVHEDRIASAWLIRRRIDPEARFKFVAAKDYQPAEGELRFDMFEGEFTHEADRCTFETLLHRFGLRKDLALVALGEIIHDIDLKDDKFGRVEAAGIRLAIDSIAAQTNDDEERLRIGAEFLDRLMRSIGPSRRRS